MKASPTRTSLLAALLALMLLATSASAHLPEFFGRKFVLDGPAPPTDSPCSEDREQLREQINGFEEDLKRRRLESGAYSPELADPQGELAELYAQLCNHPAALKAYRQALQRVRVSDGLLAKSQLPILRALAKSYRAIGDFESAQLTLRAALRVHGMALGPLDAQALEDALAYFQSARDTYIDPRWHGDVGLFFQAFRDNREVWDRQLELGAPYATLRAIGLSHLRNLYLLLGTDLNHDAGGTSDAGGAAWDFMQRSQFLSFGRGSDIVDALLEQAASLGEASAKEQADLLHRRGNWEMWNGKYQRACDTYGEAWQRATDSQLESLLQKLAQPAELPEDAQLWLSLRDPGIQVKVEMQASFRVSARGAVSRMDSEALGDGPSALAGRVRRWLRDSHMRPAVRDGVCVDAELQARRYRLVD